MAKHRSKKSKKKQKTGHPAPRGLVDSPTGRGKVSSLENRKSPPSLSQEEGGGFHAQAAQSGLAARIQNRGAGVRFALTFGVVLGLFYLVYIPLSQSPVYEHYLAFVAKASSLCVKLFGVDAHTNGPYIGSGTFGIRIVPGCDGMEALALFGSAVLASPVPWVSRLSFLAVGTVALLVVNTIRIASIFIIALKNEELADYLHWNIWPGVLIVSVLVCWLVWARWAVRRLQHSGVVKSL